MQSIDICGWEKTLRALRELELSAMQGQLGLRGDCTGMTGHCRAAQGGESIMFPGFPETKAATAAPPQVIAMVKFSPSNLCNV